MKLDRILMKLMDDFFVISCHETRAKWLTKRKPAQCSACQSIHPLEFMDQLRNGGFISGFFWEDNQLSYCDTKSGRFHVKHLQDMPTQWLYESAYDIFLATGIVFYWEREMLKYDPVTVGFRMGEGSACTIPAANKKHAKKLIEAKFYGMES